MKLRWLVGLAAIAFVSSAAAQGVKGTRTPEPPAPARPPVWRTLGRFNDDAELLRYVRDVQRVAQRGRQRRDYGANDMMAPPAPPPPPVAMESAVAGAISPAAQSTGEAASITNVQTQGVDEGGIVKMVGRFLVVLQDGRLFVVDTRPGGQQSLALANRTNVYRSPNQDTWYDELLISGTRVLVTGYSYRERASEVTVFNIDINTGGLTRETTNYISSNDYYDTDNYSTRLVNGNLVIYTPLNIAHLNPNQQMQWPLVRRWLRDDQHRAVTTQGRRLFDARDIYRPIQETLMPMVHSVSVCPLGREGAGDELDCRTTAFVGPAQREFFVSTSDIYLWVTPNAWGEIDEGTCPTGETRDPNAYTVPATLFQVPLSGATPRAAHVRGQPTNQMAMDASASEFRALLGWNTSRCNRGGEHALRYFRLPFSALSTTPRNAPTRSYTQVPSVPQGEYEVRFADTHVVYGGRTGYGSYPPDSSHGPQSARVTAVPTTRPTAYTTIEAPHSILRIERTGRNIVLTGYRDDSGLSLSQVNLAGQPRIASTHVLRGRYESENRSHAFNSFIGADGSGLMGLPTVSGVKQSGRWVWRSDSSDVSYLSVDAAGQLRGLGELSARRGAVDPSYRCEVSCIDWYGNTRALYIGNRVFALSGTELIEGTVEGGRISERQRLNLSARPPRS